MAIGGLSAARKMHLSILRSCLHWPLSFFDITPVGRILNRFSNDIYVLDLVLPQLLQASIQTSFSVITRKITCENYHGGAGRQKSSIRLFLSFFFFKLLFAFA